MHFAWIIFGGSLGALSRYGLYVLQAKWFSPVWPATLLVNLIGCFGLGICFSMFASGQIHHSSRFFWMVGFWASFTTYSTFIMDIFQLAQSHQYTTIALYIGASLVLGYLAFFTGHTIHQQL